MNAPAIPVLLVRIANTPMFIPATIMEKRALTAPASATTNLEETTASTPMVIRAAVMEQCALTAPAIVMIATLVILAKRKKLLAAEEIAAIMEIVVDIRKICLTESVNVIVMMDIAETNVKL